MKKIIFICSTLFYFATFSLFAQTTQNAFSFWVGSSIPSGKFGTVALFDNSTGNVSVGL